MNLKSVKSRHRSNLREILAAESAECGLACIAMIAKSFGAGVDLNILRERHPVSHNGMTVRGIIDVSCALGLSARPLRAEISALPKLQLPAILHWNMAHFVVLSEITSKGAIIYDPTFGRRRVSASELSSSFTGVAIEFSATADFSAAASTRDVKLSSLYSGITGAWWPIAQIVLFTVTLQALVLVMPLQLQIIVDQAIERGDAPLIGIISVGFAGIVLISAAVGYFRGWAAQSFGNQMTIQIMGNIVRHVMHLPSSFMQKRHVGDVVSRTSSANRIHEVLTQGLVVAVVDGAAAIIALVVMAQYAFGVTVTMVAMVVAQSVGVAVLLPTFKKRQQRELQTSAVEQSYFIESIRAATTIKLMSGEGLREAQWRNHLVSAINAASSSGHWQLTVGAWNAVLSGLQIVVIGYLAGSLALEGGAFTVGMLFAFMAFRQIFAERFASLLSELTKFKTIEVHLQRLADIVLARSEQPADGGYYNSKVIGQIDLNGVSYCYGEGDSPVLTDLNLSISPGEFVAIRGRSGSGKSTLCRLLVGLMQPTDGTIAIDGEQGAAVRWAAWRKEIGVVMQDDQLISGSLLENISFFEPLPDIAAVHEAARSAQIHDDIERMPMRYATLVGDMGSSLSGGQRQRILLARALYKKPKILILDEGTANLDLHTEMLIAQAINQLPITRIVIAHRPALIELAHRVYVMDGGSLHSEAN